MFTKILIYQKTSLIEKSIKINTLKCRIWWNEISMWNLITKYDYKIISNCMISQRPTDHKPLVEKRQQTITNKYISFGGLLKQL